MINDISFLHRIAAILDMILAVLSRRIIPKIGTFTKKFHFSLISVSSNKKKVSGSCTHNFDATDLPNS